MLECVYITKSCTGNVIEVSDECPPKCDEVCCSCGDYATRTERVYFVRCDVSEQVSSHTVDPRGFGVSFADIKCIDAVGADNVYLVPHGVTPDYREMWGEGVG